MADKLFDDPESSCGRALRKMDLILAELGKRTSVPAASPTTLASPVAGSDPRSSERQWKKLDDSVRVPGYSNPMNPLLTSTPIF